MKKKILALCLVVVLAVTAVTGATLAYFTDVSKTVTNTFTVGDVQIKLDEAPVDPATGKEKDGDRVLENEYKDIYPGQILDKDPMVTIMANSEPSYVRMKVTANVADLAAAFPEFVDANNGMFYLEKLVQGWNNEIWEIVNVTKSGNNATYEFRYHTTTTENTADTALEPLFTEIKIPDDATSADLKALVGEDGEVDQFAFSIVAEAIQAAGFEDADDAWAAFADANPQQATPID